MEQREIPEVSIQGDKLVVSIAIEDLVWVTENRTDGKFKVLDKDQFLKDMAYHLKEYHTRNGVETGLSAIQELIDQCVGEVVENNESVEYTDMFA